ncbi:MAG: family 16 glycosylhydrolase [Marmoricola sp.]
MRVQMCVSVLAVVLATATLTSLSSTASANSVSADAARVATTGERVGETAGRKSGATAGAKAGRKAGAKISRAAAAAGERAGRKAGATAGAKAGKKVGRHSGKRASAKAGTKAGARAGARAGRLAALAVGTGCGDTTLRKANGTAWQCTFADDFTGTSLDTSKWRVMTSAVYNFGVRPDCFMNTPANVSLSSGALVLTSRRETKAVACNRGTVKFSTRYTGGLVSSYQKFSQTYGRFEFRAKFPGTTQRGLQSSAWLWPDGANGSAWPGSGEIDVAEWYSQYPDRVIPYLHTANLFPGQVTNNYCLVANVANWHSYVLEWTPSELLITIDGRTCVDGNGGSPFNKPYFVSMFQGFGLKTNAPTTLTPAISKAQFDYVRVWS